MIQLERFRVALNSSKFLISFLISYLIITDAINNALLTSAPAETRRLRGLMKIANNIA